MKSLEFNWIRKKLDKTLVDPELVFTCNEECDYGGCYISPVCGLEVFQLDGKEYRIGKNGLIVINYKYSNCIQDTIAHEMRHHWQCFNANAPLKQYDLEIDWFDAEKYPGNLVNFYQKRKHEMDAMRFSYRVSYENLSIEDEELEFILYDLIKDLKPPKIFV